MQTITTIGVEIAKSVFQVHGVDVGAQFIIRRQMKRWSVRAFFQTLKRRSFGLAKSIMINWHGVAPTNCLIPTRPIENETAVTFEDAYLRDLVGFSAHRRHQGAMSLILLSYPELPRPSRAISSIVGQFSRNNAVASCIEGACTLTLQAFRPPLFEIWK